MLCSHKMLRTGVDGPPGFRQPLRHVDPKQADSDDHARGAGEAFPGRRGARGVSGEDPLARAVPAPGLRQPERGPAQAPPMRAPVPGLPEADLGDGGHVPAPHARSAEEVDRRHPPGGDAFERDLGGAAQAAAGAGQRHGILADASEAAPGHGLLGRRPAPRVRRGGRDDGPAPAQGRPAAEAGPEARTGSS